MALKFDFFGFGGYERIPEGAGSFQHILFTSLMVLTAIFLSIFLSIKFKNKDNKKNKVIVFSAIAIDVVEIFKIIILCIRDGNVIDTILHTLPLFLCSLMLIALPLAAFCNGRIKEASLDFVLIFGFIAGVFGTVGAFQNYNAYPVISIDNVASAITHCISAFASLFIGITKMAKLKKENMWITYVILLAFSLVALVANKIIDYNYMFLERGDGTPYDIFYNLVNGNSFLYKIIVIGLFVLLISCFYIYKIIRFKKSKRDNIKQIMTRIYFSLYV